MQGEGRGRARREGNKIGARGTPAFFINGKPLVGAQPFEAFKAEIDEELKNADALLKNGRPVAKLYDEIMKDARRPRSRPLRRRRPAVRPTRHDGLQGRRRQRAGRRARRTRRSRSWRSRTSSARSARASVPTLKQIEEQYKGKVRVAFKQLAAARSTRTRSRRPRRRMAANEQGKFWEMHDKLFANQQALDRAVAREVRAGARPRHGQVQGGARLGQVQGEVNADVSDGNRLGGGTARRPSSSTAARSSGAQPIEAFAQIIDEELKKKGVH